MNVCDKIHTEDDFQGRNIQCSEDMENYRFRNLENLKCDNKYKQNPRLDYYGQKSRVILLLKTDIMVIAKSILKIIASMAIGTAAYIVAGKAGQLAASELDKLFK